MGSPHQWIIGGYKIDPAHLSKIKTAEHKGRQVPGALVRQEARVRAQIVSIVREYLGSDEKWELYFTMAIEEAVLNALHHGNDWDLTKRVHIELITEKVADQVHIALSIQDEGTIFDPDAKIAEAELPANLERPTGRGCMYIKRLAKLEMTVNPVGDPPTGKIVELRAKRPLADVPPKPVE